MSHLWLRGSIFKGHFFWAPSFIIIMPISIEESKNQYVIRDNYLYIEDVMKRINSKLKQLLHKTSKV